MFVDINTSALTDEESVKSRALQIAMETIKARARYLRSLRVNYVDTGTMSTVNYVTMMHKENAFRLVCTVCPIKFLVNL